MPFIITSQKKGIRATSGTNDSVEFHNELFETDDCVITWEDDLTPEEITALRVQEAIVTPEQLYEAAIKVKEAEILRRQAIAEIAAREI